MKTVLIVDDEAAFRKAISASLKVRGYNTLEAEDGMIGLDLAAKHRPDVIVSDVNMDNMNGFMMVEELMAEPMTARIPVIMMTAQAQGAGAWQSEANITYLDKGFSTQQLITAIESVTKK
ncbi:MAG TPA: response regulator [Bacteroidota bacterium]|nr:response regulator [Bacteroidota bacterium]